MGNKKQMFVGMNAGGLVLPSGEAILHGQEVELGEDVLANSGVQSWIKEGLLVPAGAIAAASTDSESDANLRALIEEMEALRKAIAEAGDAHQKVTVQLDDANKQIEGLKVELEAANKKTSMLETELASAKATAKADDKPKT
jgi:septal ring factor EnvC (AmiA/AmiB activator)